MDEKKLYNLAFALAIFTVVYNIVEAVFSLYFGAEDESLALFGFGIDSFIEVLSGLGIVHMILRVKRHPDSNRDTFERTALRITGIAFYIFTVGLVLSSIVSAISGHKPATTFWGMVISLVSIGFMWALIYGKTYVGTRLHSEAILADARCSKACIWMSVVLLVSSGLYELTELPFIDSIGALGLAVFAFREGRECFGKSNGGNLCCNECGCH
jgi:divalent metal cation (Fe/Co/Zn/Cd) transporter